MRGHATVLLLVLLLGAGCSAPVPVGTAAVTQGALHFVGAPDASRSGTDVDFQFLILNNSNGTTPAATLRASVDFSGTREAPKDYGATVPPIAAHANVRVHLKVAYRGTGDYEGLAEIRSGETVLDRVGLFYEECNALLPTPC